MHYTEWIDDNTNEVIINIGFNKGNTYLENVINMMKAELRAMQSLKYLYKKGLYKGNCTQRTINTTEDLENPIIGLIPKYNKRLNIYNKILKDPSLTIESFLIN